MRRDGSDEQLHQPTSTAKGTTAMTASTSIDNTSTDDITTTQAGVPPAPPATLQPAASKPQGLKAFESFTVPLTCLVIADENVRTNDDGPVDALASLIDSQGLLQDLTVIPGRGKRGSRSKLFGVVAGGRRLRALWLLRDRGRIAADEPIGCKLRDAADATAVSLAENSGRAPMHPADEFQAFAKLQTEGRSVEDIAACFGCTPLVVLRRLKLSNAAPSMLALYRNDDMQLDQLMALCLTDDHAAQIAAWDATPYDRSAHSLRRRLTESKMSTTSPAARFVTVAAYEAAGGTVHRDLFADDGAGFILDPQLLDHLVAQRLQALADDVRAEGC
jgi:ParB family chromosome partitioning protein